jgi:hypothetical protein
MGVVVVGESLSGEVDECGEAVQRGLQSARLD